MGLPPSDGGGVQVKVTEVGDKSEGAGLPGASGTSVKKNRKIIKYNNCEKRVVG